MQLCSEAYLFFSDAGGPFEVAAMSFSCPAFFVLIAWQASVVFKNNSKPSVTFPVRGQPACMFYREIHFSVT